MENKNTKINIEDLELKIYKYLKEIPSVPSIPFIKVNIN